MKERIKQLAEHALENSLFETIEPTITVGEGENKVTIPMVFAEKFAELLEKEFEAKHFSEGYLHGQSAGIKDTVQTILGIIDGSTFDTSVEEEPTDPVGKGWYMAQESFKNVIKRQFGVEE